MAGHPCVCFIFGGRRYCCCCCCYVFFCSSDWLCLVIVVAGVVLDGFVSFVGCRLMSILVLSLLSLFVVAVVDFIFWCCLPVSLLTLMLPMLIDTMCPVWYHTCIFFVACKGTQSVTVQPRPTPPHPSTLPQHLRSLPNPPCLFVALFPASRNRATTREACA